MSRYTRTNNFPAGQKARGAEVKAELDAVQQWSADMPDSDEVWSGNVNYAAAGGTANAITFVAPNTWTSYTGKDGYKLSIRIAADNTGAATLNVDGLGAKAVVRNDGTALQAADLKQHGIYEFSYNESQEKFYVTAFNGIAIAAEASAAAAAASAAAALSSQNAASSSASSASSSASSASSSASTATTQAGIATTQAGIATTQAGIATAAAASITGSTTGTGAYVRADSPTLTTPALGTPSAIVLTNASGTASININGTVGATTPAAGAFTTLAASGAVTLSASSNFPTTGMFLRSATNQLILTGGSAGFLFGAESGASTFATLDNTGLGILTGTLQSGYQLTVGSGSASTNGLISLNGATTNDYGSGIAFRRGGTSKGFIGTQSWVVSGASDDITLYAAAGSALRFYSNGQDVGRWDTSGNLGLGTSTITDPYGTSNHKLLTMSGTWGGVISFALGSTTYASVGNRPSGNTGLRLAAYGSSVYDLVEIVTNGSVRATFDVSGNLGLGVTPSAWASSFRALQIGTRTNLSQSTNSTYLGNNAYYNGANWIYQISAAAAQFSVQEDGSFLWQSTGSGTAGNPITFTQAMRLDVAGALSITGSGGTGTHPLKLTSTGCDLLRFEMNTAGGGSYIQSTNAAESAYEPLGFYAESYAFNVGKIGIGGAALTDQLNVLGAARFGDGTNYAGISADATGTLIESAAGAHTVRINTAGAQAVIWDANGNLIQKLNASAPTLGTNSTMTFELTDNTTLSFVVKGTDGTVRSGSLALAA